jgi:type III secretory pathway component EscR
MRGGRRTGAGRKKKPDHLRRELVTIRLPQWMISQLKTNGEIGYLIENELVKIDFLTLPDDYIIGS